MENDHNSPPKRHHNSSRQIVGFSLSPNLAAEVKMEAARRNISLKALFKEIWDFYKSNKKD